jgi:hypothetical protein
MIVEVLKGLLFCFCKVSIFFSNQNQTKKPITIKASINKNSCIFTLNDFEVEIDFCIATQDYDANEVKAN